MRRALSAILWLGTCVVVGACAVRGCDGTERPAGQEGALTPSERAQIPGAVVFVSERDGQKDVWLVTPEGVERRLTDGAADEYPAAVRPDGEALAVVAAREEGGVHLEQLFLQPLAPGAGSMPLSPRPSARFRNASWGPDGTWLVAESDLDGFSDLVRIPVGGGASEHLTRIPEGAFEPAVSPDGRQLAYVSSREGDPELYVLELASGPTRRLTSFHREDVSPSWSPDGQWLAFLSNRAGRDRVYLVRPDGTGLRALSGTATTGEEKDAAWSPDSRSLLFVEKSAKGTSRVWRAVLDAAAPVALTDGSARDEMPAWSPDGRYLVFASNRSGDTDLYLARADGTGIIQLTNAKGADWLPRWVPATKTAPPLPAQQ